MSSRVPPSEVLSYLHRNLLSTISKIERDSSFEQEDVSDSLVEAQSTLNRELRLVVKHLYGHKTSAYTNFWGGEYGVFQKAQMLSKQFGGGRAVLIALAEQVGELIKTAQAREAQFKDQETIEKKVFTHNGFKVVAYNLSEAVMEAMLEPLDVVTHLFKKRGVEVVLHEALEKVVLRSDPEHEIDGGWGTANAFYQSIDKTVFLNDIILDATCEIEGIKGIVYGFVHEIGHWLHFDFLTKDAYDYWNKSWAGVIPEGMDYLTYEQAVENDYLKELGVPTNYGRRDPFEDFAETFSFFILNPSKLSDRACERMKETLRMSMRGGRLFMRVAHLPHHLRF